VRDDGQVAVDSFGHLLVQFNVNLIIGSWIVLTHGGTGKTMKDSKTIVNEGTDGALF
jgi:hypothetical protein